MEERQLDYTKYRLKSAAGIRDVFARADSIYVLWCEKCNHLFADEEIAQCWNLLEGAGVEKSKIRGCAGLDFLCNRAANEEKIRALGLDGCGAIGVASCGLGIQLVAGLFPSAKVYALADSIPQSGNATSLTGYQGVSLAPEKCAACAQCYLNLTGGICPIVNCAKSLVNGQCGGAKNGKCEVDMARPCAWEEINARLAGQNRPRIGNPAPRNFEAFPFAEKKQRSAAVAERRGRGFAGGVYPRENKEQAAELAIRPLPSAPARVCIFLSQHTGSPARALVKPGERVCAGQKIGERAGLVSAAVHASVSGRVAAVEERPHPSLRRPMPAVVIENDFRQERVAACACGGDWRAASPEALRGLIDEAGVVGLGGAMFPTHVKLMPPRPVDTLLVNGCECEPWLNADNRLMQERPAAVLEGAAIAARILGAATVLVAVEENKPEALAALREAGREYPGVSFAAVPTKYPEGAERMLIRRTLDRAVPRGGLPMDVGVVVLNAGTAVAVRDAVCEGIPLIERVVTVAGPALAAPGNYRVPIGTPLADIVRACAGGGTLPSGTQVRMGGPMMGILQESPDTAVIKGTSGFTFLPAPAVPAAPERDCIKCGRCVEVCPVNLLPNQYAFHGKRGEWDKAAEYDAKSCIECGSCEYVCSSKIALVRLIQQVKAHAHHKG